MKQTNISIYFEEPGLHCDNLQIKKLVLLLFSGASFGSMAFGAMIDAVGMRWSFRIGGIISIVTCALFALLHNVLPPYMPENEVEATADLKDAKEPSESNHNGTAEHNREEGEEGKLCVEIEQGKMPLGSTCTEQAEKNNMC